MRRRQLILYILLLAVSSCSVRRYLPEGEKLYKGATVVVHKNPETKSTKSSLESDLRLAVKPRKNKFLLGQPYKVWWWYKLGEPNANKKESRFKAFLRKQFAEPPVLSSRVNAKATAENMQGLMENLGYFHTTVTGDTIHSGRYFIKSVYTAEVQPQYHIRNVTWVSDSSALLKLLETEQKRNSILKAGNAYRLSDISAERDRLDLFLKRRGFYFFNPDFLMAYADSTIGNRQVEILLNVKRSTPDSAKYPYTIRRIYVFPGYSLASAQLDTTMNGFEAYDTLFIRDPRKRYKPQLFARTITYRPGSIYNSRRQNATLNRLINLSAFKFVKNTFRSVHDSAGDHKLDVQYFLTPARKKSVQAEIDGFSKDNNSLGAQFSSNWKNRNLFRGAEQLMVKVYTGFEVSFADSLTNNNSYRIGAEASIKFPKYVVPFRVKENNFYPPNTNFLIGYELYRKQLYYTKNLFRAQYDFTWKPSFRKEITLAPIAISYLNATNVTDSFYRQAAKTPDIILNVYSEVILGSYFSYTYNNTLGNRRNKLYFNFSADISGNIAGLITGTKGYREKTVLGTPFAQYVKTDYQVNYTRRLGKKMDWANRIQLGIGIPYNNSSLLPFAKQYTIGGSSSVRGFRVRNVGPGAYKPSAEDQRFFQIIGGDYKFLANTELRIPLTSVISTAVFLDIGNVWTKDTLLFGQAGKLTKDWYKQLAVASGIGLRFDATVLLIRADLGIPLRKPYLPQGQQWVLNQIDFGSSSWRRENLVLNIALGLPF